MRKPSLTLNCVANTYAANGERIAEFSFPEIAQPGLPGGLISLRYRDGAPPLVSLYRVEGCEISVPVSNVRTTDAARLHGFLEELSGDLRRGSGVTLHEIRRKLAAWLEG